MKIYRCNQFRLPLSLLNVEDIVTLSSPIVFIMSTSILPPPSDTAGPSSSSTLPPLSELVKRSVKRTRAIYAYEGVSTDDGLARAWAAETYLTFIYSAEMLHRNKIKLATKLAAEYKDVQTLPPVLASQQAGPTGPKRPTAPAGNGPNVKLIGGPESSSSWVK